MSKREEFIEIYQNNIKRDGADKLLEFLEGSDFFTCPASTKFHNILIVFAILANYQFF